MIDRFLDSPHLSRKTICKILGVSSATFDRWVANGNFPEGVKFGHSNNATVRWRPSTVKNWIRKKSGEIDVEIVDEVSNKPVYSALLDGLQDD